MKGNIILVVTALIVIGVTITAYNVACDELTSTLKLSMTVACLSELAIVCTLGLVPSVNYKNGATGMMFFLYAVLMLVWALVGPQLLSETTFKLWCLIISAVMVVLIGLSTFGSHKSDELNQSVEATIIKKKDTKQYITSMWLSTLPIIGNDELRNLVRILVERIQALPASRFPDATIENGMKEVFAMCRAMSNSEVKERVSERLQAKVSELTLYVKSL